MVYESRARVDAAIPRVSGLLITPPEPAAVGVIRTDWRGACTALDGIDQLFDQIGEALWAEYTNSDLTDQARNTRVQSVITQYRAVFDAQSQAASGALTGVLQAAAKASAPPRPQPEDALQEARIAGIKSDLTMLLASRDEAGALVAEVDEYLARALASGDKLAVWVVAGSGWLDLYIRSRDEDQYFATQATGLLDQAVSTRLDSQPSADPAFDLRQLNRVLSDPQRGAQSILTILGGFAVQVFDDLAGWQPLTAAQG
jgi:hypothetical protein